MADERDLRIAATPHEPVYVIGHRAFVVARKRFFGVPIAPEVRHDHAIAFRELRDLLAPCEPGLREAVEQEHLGSFAGFYVMDLMPFTLVV
jgi:hypothetical protein